MASGWRLEIELRAGGMCGMHKRWKRSSDRANGRDIEQASSFNRSATRLAPSLALTRPEH